MRAVRFIPLLVIFLLTPGMARAQAGLPAWDVVPSPNGGHGDNTLTGVDALTAGQAWAVGYSGDYLTPHPLAQRFDGASWTLVETPSTAPAFLYAVKTLADDDVWSVGGYESTGNSLIEHWDGTQWSLVSHPEKGTFNQLYAVDGTSASDVWAVGEYASGGVTKTLVQHWDGTAWSVVASPNVGTGYNHLYGVTALAPDDAWAVGQDGNYKSLTLHWDGTSWVRVPSPSDGRVTFRAVTALTADDIWAVGYSTTKTTTAHWDGTAWTLVPSPSPGRFYKQLHGVEAIAPDDVWAVGAYSTGPEYLTLVLHWDGTAWTEVESPSEGDYSELWSVSATGPSDVWTVGVADDASLAVRWDGNALARVPSDNVGTGANHLKGVHVADPDDIWVVGQLEQSTLTEHGDGTSFAIVPSPNLPGRTNILEGVHGSATADVWAVGHADVTGFIGSKSLIEHWNGSKWSIVPSPSMGRQTDKNDLYDVAAISPTEAWAVGTFESISSFRSIVLRWDGSRWRTVKANCGFGLTGIDAISSTDIWAVGGADTCHWDGSRWTRFPAAPAPDGRSSVNLIDVTIAAANDVWAVGHEASPCGEGQICFSGMVQHWNGTKWSVDFFAGESLNGVHANSPSDVYAVGLGYGVVIIHFDGSEWATVPVPDLPSDYGILTDVDGSSAADLWAGGEQGSGPNTLVMHAPSATSGAVEGHTNVGGAVVSWFGPETGSVETDSFGDYQVGGLTAGTYTFIASNPGCDPGVAQVAVPAGTTIVQDLHLGC